MNKLAYLKRVFGNTNHETAVWLYRKWVLSTFSILTIKDSGKLDIPYIGYMTKEGYKFKDDDGNEHILEDTSPSLPVLTVQDRYTVKELYPYLTDKDTPKEDNLGNILANIIVIAYPFTTIPYQPRGWSLRSLEAKHISIGMLKDKDEAGYISVQQYLKYVEAVKYLTEFSHLFVISSTPKTITASPEAVKIRKQLVKKYKDKLDDYTVVAKIEDAVRKADEEYLKDDPTYGKFIGGKIKNIARKRMFGTYGGEEDYSNPGHAVFIEESLEEGLPPDPEKLVAAFNGVRMGSFSRGAETQKGGKAAKELLRVLNGFKVVPGDCGTKRSVKYKIDASNTAFLIGLTIIDKNNNHIKLTKEIIEKRDGQIVNLRTPLYCLSKGSTFCETCAGTRLTMKENELTLASMDASHAILTSSLKAMHGTVLSTVDVDPFELAR